MFSKYLTQTTSEITPTSVHSTPSPSCIDSDSILHRVVLIKPNQTLPKQVQAPEEMRQINQLRLGDISSIQHGDIIALGHPHSEVNNTKNHIWRYVVENTHNSDTKQNGLQLRDATTRSDFIHCGIVKLTNNRNAPFTKRLGIKNLNDSFLRNMFYNSPGTSEARLEAKDALKQLEPHNLSIIKCNPDTPSYIRCSSSSQPVMIEKAVFKKEDSILSIAGQCSSLQIGETLSIRDMFDFRLEIDESNLLFLCCDEATRDSLGMLQTQFPLGKVDKAWSVTISRDYLGTESRFISSQHCVVENNLLKPSPDVKLLKDQTSMWVGIKPRQTNSDDMKAGRLTSF